MKRSTKRMLSVLICLAMAFAMLPVAAFAAGTTAVYCQAPDDWAGCNAYWWGSSAENPTWPGVAMTQDAEGIWGYEVPSDATGLIFNNGSGTQTTDMTVPVDTNNMYVFANNYWKEYGKTEIVEEYFVAGVSALCGVDWVPGAAQNKMTKNEDGTYSMTYTGVAAGSYELKVTMGSWASCWGAPDSTENYMLDVTEAGSTVVIYFNTDTKLVSHVINPAPQPEPEPEPDIPAETLIREGTAAFATGADAWGNPDLLEFVPGADGIIKISIISCDPGYFVEVYADGEWVEDCVGDVARVIELPVTKGVTYEFWISSGIDTSAGADKVAGTVTYKITANVAAGEPEQGEDPVDPPLDNSPENPQLITSYYGKYIEAGQTVWFLFDNTEHMMNDGVYSQMLYISAGVPYAVTYKGADVPVDAEGFVAYEMMDVMYSGKYLFSVTNNASSVAYFTIEVKDRPAYVISDVVLVLGDNEVLPDPEFSKTLYEFAPDETGVYSFTISEGFIGNWGTYFNPVDNTGTKDTMIQWTCTAVGQGVMIGVTETEEAVLTIAKTADYIPPNEVPETVYENVYDFSYQMPEEPDVVAIDVLDDKEDKAVLDQNGFYRYGSKYGPLMVADLSSFPINLADAALNGQLKAYVYDNNGKLIAKFNYNEAMTEYLDAGLVPVTEELGRMLQQIGHHRTWWQAGGFVFEGEAPADETTAWMVACSWLKGSELDPEDDNDQGSNNQGGNNQGGNNQGGNNQGSNNQNGSNDNPKTTDISMAWAMIALILASTCLVVLKKKESFFLN